MTEPQYLLDAVSLIERHYDRRLSLAVLATHLGIPRTTLSSAFRRCRKTSAGAFIRAVRVRRATQMLLETNARIHEVAQQTGFFDQSHFVRTFRRLTGVRVAEILRPAPSS